MDKKNPLTYNKRKRRGKEESDLQRQKKAVCTTGLIIINIGIFLGIMLIGRDGDTMFLLEHGAMYEPYVLEGKEYYRLVTSMFLHFGMQHLLNNMVMLGALGWNLEFITGKVRFVLIYLFSGVGGNLLSLLINRNSGTYVVSAGASGAVFGLMGALLFAAIRNRGQVGRVSRRGLIVMVALSLYFGLSSSGVDNAAHIGGLICGFLLEAVLGGIWRIVCKGRYKSHRKS